MATSEDQPQGENQTLKGRWSKLDSQRTEILERARECSKLTIPSLLPPEGHNENQKLYTPYQGLGARGVNNLASKLLLALFPPNAPFFKLTINDFNLKQLTDQSGISDQIEEAFHQIEHAVMRQIEVDALRVQVFEALKHLVTTGNILIYMPREGGMKVFRLDRYCVRRDPKGNVLEILVKESIHPVALPDDVREKVEAQIEENRDEPVDLFTQIVRQNDRWVVSQECGEVKIPQSKGSYPLDKSPWLPLRWTSISNEDYGRGMVEEYLGDFKSLEALSKSIVEGAAIASRILGLVNPNGTTRPDTIQNAPNGAIVEGDADDVTILNFAEKFPDFRFALEEKQEIEQRLAFAFLLFESVQRDAERVTAQEIRMVARELEDALGGVYSVLSQEMQLPFVRVLMDRMESSNKLPKLPDGVVAPMIVTGLEALGRGNDLDRLNMFLQSVAPLGPEVVNMYLIPHDYIMRVAASQGIDTTGLIRSEQEVQQMRQNAMMQAMAQSTVPGVVQEVTKGVTNAATQQARQQQQQQGVGGS